MFRSAINLKQKTLRIAYQSVRNRYMESPTKRMKMTGPLIGTHNGNFHADEALAVYMLRLLPEYKDSPLLRSRDYEKLKTCDIVVDVGAVYDDSTKRYDHHQREFNTTFPNHSTKLSSAGLVYMHYGKQVISECCKIPQDHHENEIIYQKIYDDFIESVDANDNGISIFDSSEIRKAGIQKKFQDNNFSMASVVGRMNRGPPSFEKEKNMEKEELSEEAKQAVEDERFEKASQFMGEQFLSILWSKANLWLPARSVVKEAFESRHKFDDQGRIMVMPSKDNNVPWSDHLSSFEEEQNAVGQVLYVLSAESTEPDSKWRIKAVPIEQGSFENRKPLPAQWRGLRDQELDKVSNIPGCVFVHASGFMGINATFEGALQIAQKSLLL